jgi:cytidine deaminase
MQDLLKAAMSARAKAHAPYSKFYVGAAMRDEHGNVHAGCNIVLNHQRFHTSS